MPISYNIKTISHPNTFTISKGETLLAEKVESINQSIRLILTTSRGELFGDPEYGCRLQEFLFDQMGTTLSQELKIEIVEALTQYESRIEVTPQDITAVFNQRTVNISIAYRIRYTDYQSSYTYVVDKEVNDGNQ